MQREINGMTRKVEKLDLKIDEIAGTPEETLFADKKMPHNCRHKTCSGPAYHADKEGHWVCKDHRLFK